MLYVQQSLGPQEEIIMGAHFHWMYTLQAVFWIMLGIAAGIAVGYAAVWWEVTQGIRAAYPGIPDTLFDRAWAQVVQEKGGYLRILWQQHVVIRFCILGMLLLGLYLFAHMMIIKATTEIAVTNERLIYKRGLVARDVGELHIDRIEGVAVQQGILGRLLGYGRVSIRGMGVGEVILPPIEAPIAFHKAVNEAKSMQEHDDRSGPLRSTEDF